MGAGRASGGVVVTPAGEVFRVKGRHKKRKLATVVTVTFKTNGPVHLDVTMNAHVTCSIHTCVSLSPLARTVSH